MRTGQAQSLLSTQLESLENKLTVLEREVSWRELNEKIGFYQPNKPIQDLIRFIGEQQNFVYILSAANGIGKTTGIINIIGNIVFGPQNSLFNYQVFRDWPYLKRIRIVSEPSQVKESGPIPTEIKIWWPKGRYSEHKSGHPYTSEYRTDTGFIVEIMTYEQHEKQHEGQNCGAVFFNEPPPAHLWTPNVSRLRMGGFVVVVMTPLTQAGWFFEDVVPKHDRFVIYADVEAACKQHGINGHLEHANIEKMTSEYSEEEKEARVGGKAMYLKGLIFKTFYPNVHILRQEIRPPAGAYIWNVVDPHADKPFASIWAFPDARGDIFIFDEWPNQDFYKMHNCQLTILDYKRIFGDKEAGLYVYRRIIDRHFAETPAATNKRTLRQELQAIGLNYLPSYKAEEEIETGIIKVREYLRYDTKRALTALNQPKIYINPSCRNTINSLSKWSRDPDTGKVKDEFKDFCDLLRYLLMDNPGIPESTPTREPKKRW